MIRGLQLFIFLCLASTIFGQNIRISQRIIVTDTVEDEGVFFAASSDDAEQQNDEIDALYDDDLDAGWEGAPEDLNVLTTGLRFRNIAIPTGATIDSAFIVLHSHESKSTDDVAEITIYANNTGNAFTFNETDLITDLPQTNSKINWTVDEEWGLWTAHKTPDLKNIVQEIINRTDWKAGNAVAFVLSGQDQGPSEVENTREFESFENIADPEDGGDGQNHPERVPELVVYYSVKSGLIEIPIMVTDTVEDEGVFFAGSSDDAEQQNDEIDALYDDDLDAGWEGAPEDLNVLTTGLRFRNIALPKGAVIDSAFIVLHSHESKSADDVAEITIFGDDTDDAETFTEDVLIDARPKTDAVINWTVDEEWGLWTAHKTPNLKSIITELITRQGWNPGNDMAFVLQGNDQGPSETENAREFESFENIADPEDGGDGQNHPERVPMLKIYFSSPNLSTSTNEMDFTEILPLSIYPNPTGTQNITVDFPTASSAKIEVYNLEGKLIRKYLSQNDKNVNLNLGGLNSGMYIIKAMQSNVHFIQHLIIE